MLRQHLLSRSTSASGWLPEIILEVRLRRVQTGPEMSMASLAQRIAEEEVSSDSECSQVATRKCRCFRSDNDKGTQGRNGAHIDDTAAEENAHRGASGCGAGPASGGPKVVSSSQANSHRHGTFGAFATCMCDHPSIGKFLRFCVASLYIVDLVCSGAHPGKHWPAFFDQTCGYPGEGPLTTLDSPDAPGMCLAPTQEIAT